MTITLTGRVTSGGTPVPGAMIRLLADETTLGSDAHAASDSRGTVGWTCALTSVSGSLWNTWQKHVARDVAGLTWEEFRVEALQYNPALRLTDEVFQPDQTYFMPENRIYSDTRTAAPTLVWERTLTGFDGSQWDCWRRFVQGKVSGLTWLDSGTRSWRTTRNWPRGTGASEATPCIFSRGA